MIPLPVVMLNKLLQGPPEMALPQRNYPVEALGLDRSHEPLRIGIRPDDQNDVSRTSTCGR